MSKTTALVITLQMIFSQVSVVNLVDLSFLSICLAICDALTGSRPPCNELDVRAGQGGVLAKYRER